MFWILTASFTGVVVFLAYLVFRYVPIIERNAFEIPRHQVPEEQTLPHLAALRNFEIPFKGGMTQVSYICSPIPSRKLVIFCHETGADMRSWIKHAYFLPQEGYDVLSFNFSVPGSNSHSRSIAYQWPTTDECACLGNILNWVEVNRPGFATALFGVSKGSTLALAASGHPYVKGVICDGVFSTRLTLASYMKKWVGIYALHEGFARFIVRPWMYLGLAELALRYACQRKKLGFFSIESYLKKTCPHTLLIHAENDAFARMEHIQKIKSQFGDRAQLWVAKGADHSNSIVTHPGEYQEVVLQFLAKRLDPLIPRPLD